MKNEAPEARKIHKIGTWSRLGGSWSGSWRPGRDFLGISAKLARRCIAESLQKHKENNSFFIFWGAWGGAVTRKSGPGAVLVYLGAPFGVLRAIF